MWPSLVSRQAQDGLGEQKIKSTEIIYKIITRVQMRDNKCLSLCNVCKNGEKILKGGKFLRGNSKDIQVSSQGHSCWNEH